MNVAFRADASMCIGTGHVMRCLALADELSANGVRCIFLSRNHQGHLHELVMSHGHALINLGPADANSNSSITNSYVSWLGVEQRRDAEDCLTRIKGLSIDWLVVDHYSIDESWESLLRSQCNHIMAIDDLANRNHDVDLLLDQNLSKNPSHYYDKIPSHCNLMLGPSYALLRPEFAAIRGASLSRRIDSRVKKLLLTMGGVDLNNSTSEVLDAINKFKSVDGIDITVIMGQSSPWVEHVIHQTKELKFKTQVLSNVRGMAELMCNSDLAIGAAGGTSWERCCLGLPTIQTVLAENQRPIAKALCQFGAALTLENSDLCNSLHIALDQLLNNSELRLNMSIAAANLVDGLGTKRVANYLMKG